MEKSQSIIIVLENLSVLKKDYNLTLTLDDYINVNITNIYMFKILLSIKMCAFCVAGFN